MRLIPLTQGKFAIVDDSDYGYLSNFKWCCGGNKGRCAVRYITEYVNGVKKRKCIMMHIFIAQNYDKSIIPGMIDHIDCNAFNNQKYNLRICSFNENAKNKRGWSKEGYKGVYYNKKVGKYFSSICANGKRIFNGYHSNKEDAAKAYNESAIIHHKEFANLNII